MAKKRLMTIWSGTFRDKRGRETECVIRVDDDRIADYISRSAHEAFDKAHSRGHYKGTRCRNSIQFELIPAATTTPPPEQP